jgi:hypothetical protein
MAEQRGLVQLHPFGFAIAPMSIYDSKDEQCTLSGFSMRLLVNRAAPGAPSATAGDAALEALLRAMGCVDGEPDEQRPAAERAAALTADAAALLCDRLSYTSLQQHFDALRALRTHQELPPAQRAPASHSAATLEALAEAAVVNAAVHNDDDASDAEKAARADIVHQAVTRVMALLPERASVVDCTLTAVVMLRLLAMQTLSLSLQGLLECDALAAAVAARNALSQRVGEAALWLADVLAYAPGVGLRPAPAAALRVRAQAVAFDMLTTLLTALHTQPHDAAARDAAAALADASTRVALTVLRRGAAEHRCVFGHAALTLSAAVKTSPAARAHAFAAGALPILVGILNDSSMLMSCKAAVLAGAGDVAHVAPDAATITPLLNQAFDCICAVSRHPHLLDAGAHGIPGAKGSRGALLHATVCVLATLCDVADVRQLFLHHAPSLRFVAAAAAARPHAAHTATLLRERVLPALAQPPTRTMRDEAQGYAALLANEGGDAQQQQQQQPRDTECAGCGARGAGFKRCGRCRHARYCTKECQAGHWAAHKGTCRKPQPRREDAEE